MNRNFDKKSLTCCRPFLKMAKCKSTLRKLTPKTIMKLEAAGCILALNENMMICDSCRVQAYKPNRIARM